MWRLLVSIKRRYERAGMWLGVAAMRNEASLPWLMGVLILYSGLLQLSYAQGGGPQGSFTENAYGDDLVRCAVANLYKLVEGAFGALVMVVAGLGAIIAAAMGAYRASLGMLVVAVGSFILRSLVSLFFGDNFTDCEATG